jgi:hypothetical protein
MKAKRVKITLDLPVCVLAELAILSAEYDKSVNWICEQALKNYIKKIENEKNISSNSTSKS